MLKILTFLVIIGFAWWRIQRFFWVRRLQKQGIKPPEQKGPRPVALLAAGLVGAYVALLLWQLLIPTD